jgi:hypothetical protein
LFYSAEQLSSFLKIPHSKWVKSGHRGKNAFEVSMAFAMAKTILAHNISSRYVRELKLAKTKLPII